MNLLCAPEILRLPPDVLIDALRFQRTDGDVPAVADCYGELLCMDDRGQIRSYPAKQAPWHSVIAIRAPDLSTEFCECEICGGVAHIAYQQSTGEAGESVLYLGESCPNCPGLDEWVGEAP